MTKNGIIPGQRLTVEIYQYIVDDPHFTDGLWRDRANCVKMVDDYPEDFAVTDWFPAERGSRPSKKVIQICHECEVRLACLSYAIQTGQPEGIWAGHLARKIRTMARKIRRAG